MKELSDLNLEDFDYLDFGSSEGESLEYAKTHFGGKRGLGLDFDPKKVAHAQSQGHDCALANIVHLELPDNCVDFVVISHVLEHLKSPLEAERTLASACRTARKFVFVRGPWFDADAYLNALGLKFYWSDWLVHRYHIGQKELHGHLEELGIHHVHYYGRERILDSGHSTVHPLTAPADKHHYREEYGPKPYFTFCRPVFREVMAIVHLADFPEHDQLLSHDPEIEPLEEAFPGFTPGAELYDKDSIINDQHQAILSLMQQTKP